MSLNGGEKGREYKYKETVNGEEEGREYKDKGLASIFQSSTTRSNALEMLYGIYQILKNTEFKYVTLVELKSMLGVVQDLKSARLEVWWLRERLDEVCEALRLSRGYPNLKVALASNEKVSL
ncbi:hypothetical protein RJ639_025762 [Escallonia herrerae]|uniref:Uncharacterized protein n=1 Tax=Escallonia herrerae TaxID=1293975 RepID=A0AA88RW19_9ASTE|nr:hypothetical protein RJ639_025762 [Escallonia herrerae]